uniref:CCD97-like C-terminal domain-containing protein n=1 Tax=Aegilops tauschii subsp. strangulata TaxID=200361 RepID=A0A453QKP0_AEGTS
IIRCSFSHISRCQNTVSHRLATFGRVVAHDEAGGCPNGTAGPPAGTFKSILSDEEMQDQLEQFTSVMQEKFLSGQDSEHMDYPQIDNDEMLDDHWSREANYDAEDKYFNED